MQSTVKTMSVQGTILVLDGVSTNRIMLKVQLTAAWSDDSELRHTLSALPAQLEEMTDQLAQHIGGLAPLAVKAMKTILQQAAAGGIDFEAAGKLSDQCLESEDLQEGFAAQREKRPPRFKGR